MNESEYEGFYAIDHTSNTVYNKQKVEVGTMSQDSEMNYIVTFNAGFELFDEETQAPLTVVSVDSLSYVFFNIAFDSNEIFVDWNNEICVWASGTNTIGHINEYFQCVSYANDVVYDLKHKDESSPVLHFGEKPEVYVIHLDKLFPQDEGYMVEDFWAPSGTAVGFYELSSHYIWLYDGTGPVFAHHSNYVVDADDNDEIVDLYKQTCYTKLEHWEEKEFNADQYSCGGMDMQSPQFFGTDVRGQVLVDLVSMTCQRNVFFKMEPMMEEADNVVTVDGKDPRHNQ